MSIPKNHDDFVERYNSNVKDDGNGIVHAPCPFCGAADFSVYPILKLKEFLTQGAVCKECDRGAKGIFNQTEEGLHIEIVQTSGPDPEPWAKNGIKRYQPN